MPGGGGGAWAEPLSPGVPPTRGPVQLGRGPQPSPSALSALRGLGWLETGLPRVSGAWRLWVRARRSGDPPQAALPVWHWAPVKPAGHWQTKAPGRSLQEPPFLHGCVWHSSVSAETGRSSVSAETGQEAAWPSTGPTGPWDSWVPCGFRLTPPFSIVCPAEASPPPPRSLRGPEASWAWPSRGGGFRVLPRGEGLRARPSVYPVGLPSLCWLGAQGQGSERDSLHPTSSTPEAEAAEGKRRSRSACSAGLSVSLGRWRQRCL